MERPPRRGNANGREGGRDVEYALARARAPLPPLSPLLRFQRESRVYEQRVPSHSVLAEGRV